MTLTDLENLYYHVLGAGKTDVKSSKLAHARNVSQTSQALGSQPENGEELDDGHPSASNRIKGVRFNNTHGPITGKRTVRDEDDAEDNAEEAYVEPGDRVPKRQNRTRYHTIPHSRSTPYTIQGQTEALHFGPD